MTDLRVHLAAALGAGYRIERELGGGGMSRVFVAHDLTLQRDVVVSNLAEEGETEFLVRCEPRRFEGETSAIEIDKHVGEVALHEMR